jgi:multicomponent Na+:H+ antiporter subunit B
MRALTALVLVAVVGLGLVLCLGELPFGTNHVEDVSKPGRHYLTQGTEETGAANAVTSVVVTYRGFDTLGEVTVLFIAAIGLGAVLFRRKKEEAGEVTPASFVLRTGCRFLFPLILTVGVYVFVHGHLTPGGGFQGGVIVASGFLLAYIGCAEMKMRRKWLAGMESAAGTLFVLAGLIGLAWGGGFLANSLPRGELNTLFSAGLIPLLYMLIGLKVGSELAGIVGDLLERAG